MKNDEFNELLRNYGSMAYRMAYQLTGGKESEAGDLVQDLFIKLWNRWDSPRPTSMRGWMYRVLRNLFLDHLRSRKRSATCSLQSGNDGATDWSDLIPDASLNIETALEKKDLQREVAEALQQLEEDFRLPVMLCDMEGLRYEDIARILNCPVGTVRSRIHRGRMQLRKILNINRPQEVRP